MLSKTGSAKGALCLECGWVVVSWNGKDLKGCACRDGIVVEGEQVDGNPKKFVWVKVKMLSSSAKA